MTGAGSKDPPRGPNAPTTDKKLRNGPHANAVGIAASTSTTTTFARWRSARNSTASPTKSKPSTPRAAKRSTSTRSADGVGSTAHPHCGHLDTEDGEQRGPMIGSATRIQPRSATIGIGAISRYPTKQIGHHRQSSASDPTLDRRCRWLRKLQSVEHFFPP